MLFAIMFAVVNSTPIAVPDPSLTPGAVDIQVSTRELCTPGYTAKIRYVSDKTKSEVFRRYGIERDATKYEVDHFISLEIGGLNDISNLWPENWNDARRKDAIENLLHRKLCYGEITIRQAQSMIRHWWDFEKINSGKKRPVESLSLPR